MAEANGHSAWTVKYIPGPQDVAYDMAAAGGRKLPMPQTGQRSFAITQPYFAHSDEIFDTSPPGPAQLVAMLENDNMARALDKVHTLPLLSVDFDIEPHKNDSGEAEFVRTVLFADEFEGGMTTSIETFLEQMWGALVRKRAFFEKVWRVAPELPAIDGVQPVAYHKLAWAPPDTCNVRQDANGSFNGFAQLGVRRPPARTPRSRSMVRELFDPEKAFVFIHDQAHAPLVGRSIFDASYKDHVNKKKLEYLWWQYCQRQALASIKGTYEGADPNGDKAMRDKALEMMGGGVLIGKKGEEYEWWGAPGNPGAAFKEGALYLNQQMALGSLAGFLNLPADDGTGSYALSADQSDFFIITLQRYLNLAAHELTNFVVAPLLRHNYAKPAFPRWKFAKLRDDDLQRMQDLFIAIVTNPTGLQAVPPPLIRELARGTAENHGIDLEKLEEEAGEKNAPIALESVVEQNPAIAAAARALEQRAKANGERRAEGAPVGTA